MSLPWVFGISVLLRYQFRISITFSIFYYHYLFLSLLESSEVFTELSFHQLILESELSSYLLFQRGWTSLQSYQNFLKILSSKFCKIVKLFSFLFTGRRFRSLPSSAVFFHELKVFNLYTKYSMKWSYYYNWKGCFIFISSLIIYLF